MAATSIVLFALLYRLSAAAEAECGAKSCDLTSLLQTGQLVTSGAQRSEAEANRTQQSVVQTELKAESKWPLSRTWGGLRAGLGDMGSTNIVPLQGQYAAWKGFHGMPLSPGEAKLASFGKARREAVAARRWREFQIYSRRRIGEVKWFNPWHEGPHPWGWTTKMDQAVAGARIVNRMQKKRAFAESAAARKALGLDLAANIEAHQIERSAALSSAGFKDGVFAGAEGAKAKLLEGGGLEAGLAAGDGLLGEGLEDGLLRNDLGTGGYEGGLAAGAAGIRREAALDAGLYNNGVTQAQADESLYRNGIGFGEAEAPYGIGLGGGLGAGAALEADGLGAGAELAQGGLGEGATLASDGFGLGEAEIPLDSGLPAIDLSSRGSQAMEYRLEANQHARDALALEKSYFQAKLDADQAALNAAEADSYDDVRLRGDESPTAAETLEKRKATKDAEIKYYKAKVAADEAALQEAMKASLVDAQLM